jgi:Na+/melibiose symporter-like transporter
MVRGAMMPCQPAPPPLAWQTSSVLSTIRLLMALLPAALVVASILIAWGYAIVRHRHFQMRAELASRRTRLPAATRDDCAGTTDLTAFLQ